MGGDGACATMYIDFSVIQGLNPTRVCLPLRQNYKKRKTEKKEEREMPECILLSLTVIIPGPPPGLSPFFPYMATGPIEEVLSPFIAGAAVCFNRFPQRPD